MLKETPVMPQKFKKKEAPINLEIDDMPPRVEGVQTALQQHDQPTESENNFTIQNTEKVTNKEKHRDVSQVDKSAYNIRSSLRSPSFWSVS